MNGDQVVTIELEDSTHTAIGSPARIYEALVGGHEVVCESKGKERSYLNPREPEYIIRLAPGTPFWLRYDEGVTG